MDPEKAHRPVALGCGHVICDGCIKQVRERQNDCPSCRKPIEKILPLYI